MNITLNIVFQPEVLEALKAFSKGISATAQPGKTEAAAASVQTPPKPSPPKQEKAANNLKSVKPQEQETETETEETGEEFDDTSTTVSIEDIREMVQKTIAGGDAQKAAVKSLLTEFKVKSVSNLDVKQFPAFVQKLKAVS